MAMSINTNMGANSAVRLMDKSAREQAITMERLTSGTRINSARDDSSGLSAVTNMTSQSRGLEMGVNNANDAINMLQTADGALEDTTELFQRMRELGLQAMNTTYTSAQRQDMNMEFQALNSEINRIASITKFNNQQVLRGSNYSFQIGWEANDDNKIFMSGFALSGVAGTLSGTVAASTVIQSISTKLSAIQTQRAKWGAVVNRLENAISNMNNMDENVKISRSRMLDTDYAKESAALAKTQVQQQAGMAMLSQANQSSQNVMSLLR